VRSDAAAARCPAVLCHPRYRSASRAPSLSTRNVRDKVPPACRRVKARKRLVISAREEFGAGRQANGRRRTFVNCGAGRQANGRRCSLRHRCGRTGLQGLVTGSPPRSTVAMTTAARQNSRRQRVRHAKALAPPWRRFAAASRPPSKFRWVMHAEVCPPRKATSSYRCLVLPWPTWD
jgi:hypothetical protein